MAFRAHPLTKYLTEYRVMGNYGYGWDEEAASTDYNEAARDYRSYLDNGGGQYRFIKGKIPNPDHGRFEVGTSVRTHPATAAWMQGFQNGAVVKVGREYITLAWSMNPAITRKFYPQHLEPLDEGQ